MSEKKRFHPGIMEAELHGVMARIAHLQAQILSLEDEKDTLEARAEKAENAREILQRKLSQLLKSVTFLRDNLSERKKIAFIKQEVLDLAFVTLKAIPSGARTTKSDLWRCIDAAKHLLSRPYVQ